MTSLSYKDSEFLLNGAPFHIFSGAIHYFRVLPQSWKDRLWKAKACGLNTVETYVPWNAHEPKPGQFKADGILDLRKFIQMAGDLDLKVILRPGPYICSEWDFGGLPSWLLSDPDMKVRTNYPGYMEAAQRYLKWALGLVVDLQYSNGGPIIAVQIENEYGSFDDDIEHLLFLKDVIEQTGIVELLVTSDSRSGMSPYIPGVLPTANFQSVKHGNLVIDMIKKLDPALPVLVMEFWTGWFDHWGSQHEERPTKIIEESLRYILSMKASVNFYMFHGGTNFGFMAGANQSHAYKPDVTSYDYGAPLAEDGTPTALYFVIQEAIQDFLRKQGIKTQNPLLDEGVLENTNRISERREIMLQEMLPWSDMIRRVKKRTSCATPITMEMCSYPSGEVQSYGYIVYQKRLDNAHLPATLTLPPYVKDRATVLLDGKVLATFDWKSDNFNVTLPGGAESGNCACVLDIMVENLGRVNYAEKDTQYLMNEQRKGMQGEVTLDGNSVTDWTVVALDFTDDFLRDVTASSAGGWREMTSRRQQRRPDPKREKTKSDGCCTDIEIICSCPGLYRAKFGMTDNPSDCFLKLGGFVKGIAIVNGFNLGRFWNLGPERTLYLPGSVLKKGEGNEIVVFEEQKADDVISFETTPQLK